MGSKKTLTRLYYGFYTISGLIAGLFGAILLFIGLPIVRVTSVETQSRIALLFGLEIDQQLLTAVLTFRFLIAGLLYLLSGAMMYKPSRDKALDWWDQTTPDEPELPNPLALFTSERTTFFVLGNNIPLTGLIVALFAWAIFNGIPLL